MSIVLAAIALAATPVVICNNPTAYDGDSVRCEGRKRALRVAGIDAPEIGHCRQGRVCVNGDPIASRNYMRRLLRRGPITFRVIGSDRYRRDVVQLFDKRGVNLSCAMIRSGHAIDKPKWNGQRCSGR